MNKRLLNTLKSKPAFLLLLPVFFVLHGFNENYNAVSVSNALLLLSKYLASTLLLFFLFLWIYKNKINAYLASFSLMAINFFFGSFHDFLKKNFADAFFTKYSFLLPSLLIFTIIYLIILKKRKLQFQKTFFYLNILFFVLIITDSSHLMLKILKAKNIPERAYLKELNICDSCNKKDIYLILADEYAGKTELNKIFSFNNDPFLEQLKKRGFHTIDSSHSNYNLTVYSVASTLNMDFIAVKDPSQPSKYVVSASNIIYNNNVVLLLKSLGYTISNLSSFDMYENHTKYPDVFLPAEEELINSQTLLNRVAHDLGYHLITTLKLNYFVRKQLYKKFDYNNEKIKTTIDISKQKSKTPKFVFTHLNLPHFPYYTDSNGNKLGSEIITAQIPTNKKQYLEYLIYSNKVLLNLIDNIQSNSLTPPIIILFSDHGFRHFIDEKNTSMQFNNLIALNLGDSNYNQFYKGMSTVNLFRALFNVEFHQHLSILKDDSTISTNLKIE
ncbi:MAG: sulfatase-like hydrolase/transferase [Chitinophagaceae bacterium]